MSIGPVDVGVNEMPSASGFFDPVGQPDVTAGPTAYLDYAARSRIPDAYLRARQQAIIDELSHALDAPNSGAGSSPGAGGGGGAAMGGFARLRPRAY